MRVALAPVGGITSMEVPVTTPTPLSMVSVVAPVTDQARVVGAPAATFAGVAVKVLMVGGGTTVMATDRVVDPAALVAVRV